MRLNGGEDGIHAFKDPVKPGRGSDPWTEFKSYIVGSIRFYRNDPCALAQEFQSGFYISIVQVPESVAFSLVAGVHPTQGLYGSFWIGLITALFGGRPGMVSGCAGALAVVVREVMRDSGPFGNVCPEERREYLLFVMVLTGILQLLCAIFQFAHLVRLIPKTASLGFFNGLAVLIFISQVDFFKKGSVAAATGLSSGCRAVDFGFRQQTTWYGLNEDTTWLMITEVIVVMFFMGMMPFLPKIPMGRFGQRSLANLIPPSLVGLLLATAYEWLILRPNGWSTPVLKDFSKMSGALSPWHVPDVPWDQWETWSKSLPIAISLCVIGLVESMLTMQAVDQEYAQRSCTVKKTQECLAQGLGNLVSGFFMGLGGDATMSQSTTNVAVGARGRLSAFIGALFLLLWTGVLGDFIEGLPTAALAGVLLILVLRTFEWASVAIIFRRALPLHMCATIMIVTVVSALTNLAIGIGVGILWESVAFVWTEGSTLGVTRFEGETLKTYRVEGPLFFANADAFSGEFTPQDDPRKVVVDLANSRVLDFSALHTLNNLGKRYASANKRFLIRMKAEDYGRYADICDEKAMAKQSKLRQYLPTKTVRAIHGRVMKSPLLPVRYQEFEPLPRRPSKDTGTTPQRPSAHEGRGPRQAAAARESPVVTPEAALLTKPHAGPSSAEDRPTSQASTVAKADEGGSTAGAPLQLPVMVGGDDSVVAFDASGISISPTPPPVAQAAILMPQVDVPSLPAVPGSVQEGPTGGPRSAGMLGVPQESAVVAQATADTEEDNESWVSEESV